MKTTLILEATDYEEIDQIKTALNASGWKTVVEETPNHLRSKLKHGNLTDEADTELEAVGVPHEKWARS